MLMVVGLGAVTGGGILLGRDLTRTATRSDIRAAASLEVASRWQRLPAGAIFPPTARYTEAEILTATAHLVGIAPPSRCQAAFDLRVAAKVTAAGCTVVLRATYVDASGTLVSTVGVAVMASTSAARRASSLVSPSQTSAGIRSASFPGTMADQFGDAQRQVFAFDYLRGPYLFFAAAGHADGRISKSTSVSSDLIALDTGVMTRVETS
jgi:hypothetical protein